MQCFHTPGVTTIEREHYYYVGDVMAVGKPHTKR